MSGENLITMSRLGTYGQWGNQVFQYAFLRTYAKRYGLDYACPQWAGQYFFGHQDSPITERLPAYHEKYEPCKHESCFGRPIPPIGDEVRGHDWTGWGQFDTSWYAPDRESITGLFQAVEPESIRMTAAMERLRQRGDTVIGLHLRRGDGGRMIFFWTPMVWVLKWLRENWSRFERPVLYIATEDVGLAYWFQNYRPVLMENLGFTAKAEPPPQYVYPHDHPERKPRQLSFFPDWYILQHCDVVLAAESTFGVSAAWVSRTCREFWRPRISLVGFEQVDMWNTCVSPREHLNDFPGIPGTQLDDNPEYARYWNGYKSANTAVPEEEQEIRKWM